MENENIKVELQPIQFIRDLCIGKTEDELLDAEQKFREFLLVIKEIADRLENEGKILDGFEE